MQVKVCYFAMLREQRGRAGETLQVEAETTAAALYRRLFPPGDLGPIPVMFAVNQAYVKGDHPLIEGDEIAFIPPLGGG